MPSRNETSNRPAQGPRDEAWAILLDLWLELRTAGTLPMETAETAGRQIHAAMLILAACGPEDHDEFQDVEEAVAEVARMLACVPDTRAFTMGRHARESLRGLFGRSLQLA